MGRKAKPGAVLIQPDPASRSESIAVLAETLETLDPAASASLRAAFGPTYLYMAEAAAQGDEDHWYELAPRAWKRRADDLLDHVSARLEKCSPANHYFAGRRDAEGTIEWGFWPKPERNPEEVERDDLLNKGFKENTKPVLVESWPGGTRHKYRGREVEVKKGHVALYRHGTILWEWDSDHPFPHLEGFQAVDLMREQGRKKSPPKLVPMPTGPRRKGPKGSGVLLAYNGYTIELRPIAALGDDPMTHEGMASATVIGPQDEVMKVISAWGAGAAVTAAMKVIDKVPAKTRAKRSKHSVRGSFMRRMMNI